MIFDISGFDPEKFHNISGMSYIGKPKSSTAMYITLKVADLLSQLDKVENCLVFVEKGMDISENQGKKNSFVVCDDPRLEYAKFADFFAKKRFEKEKSIKYIFSPQGYYISEDSHIESDAYIEPGCVIGPNVTIGKNAKILANSVIRRASIGDNFLSNENAVIGANGFTMAEDEKGNKIRIPTLGRVVIGNNVEVGVNVNISCGSSDDTIIDDNVKIDALVHIGHDVHIHKNAEITAGGIIGGFDELYESSYVGINATLRNRITIGSNAVIGMGSTVTKSVENDTTVVGNPARKIER